MQKIPRLLKIEKKRPQKEWTLGKILNEAAKRSILSMEHAINVYGFYQSLGILDQPLKDCYIVDQEGSQYNFSLGLHTLELYQKICDSAK